MYYYNLSAQVIANGIISPVIKMQYETHQECPLSPLIFNLELEPLACLIRQLGEIQAI